MADEKDIRIGIRTTADTSGAKEASEAIDAVGEAAGKSTEASGKQTEAAKQETAAVEKSSEAYEQWLENHRKLQAQYAATRKEIEATAAAAGAAPASTPGGPAPADAPPTSRGFGGMLDSSPIEEVTEALEEKTRAIEEQQEALDDLTDAEAGVIDATDRLNETADAPDGFQKLFSQQRLIEIGRLLRDLGREAGDFARKFAETEQGKEALAGLSEETKLLGGTVASAAQGIASGFAVGGPIGGAIGGITSLVRTLGGEWLEANARIEQSERDLEAATVAHHERLRERNREAAATYFETQLEADNERLRDQNAILEENAGLLRSRKDLLDAEFELSQAQDRAAGKSEDQLAIERIQKELRDKEAELEAERRQRLEGRNALERRGVDARQTATQIEERGGFGRNSEEFKEQEKIAAEAERDLENRRRADAKLDQEAANELAAARARAAAGLTNIATRAAGSATTDTERRREQAEREAKRQEDARAREEDARTKIGQRGEGFADQAARSVGKLQPRAADALEKIGDKLAADPSAELLAELIDALGKLSGGLDTSEADKARQLRSLRQEVERLKASILKMKTPGG